MADKLVMVGGDPGFELLFKDQGAGVYVPAISDVSGASPGTFAALTDRLPFTLPAADQQAMQVKAHSGQTANLWEFQDSSGNVTLQVEATGRISTPAVTDLSIRAGTGGNVLLGSGSVDVIEVQGSQVLFLQAIRSSAANAIGLTVRASAAQTAAIQTWNQDSGNTVLLSVAAAGHLTFGEGINLIAGTTTGSKIGTAGGAAGQKLAFWDATPIVQPLLATGAGATADNVISVLQNLGLCRQS
jgi:hypothetical protein